MKALAVTYTRRKAAAIYIKSNTPLHRSSRWVLSPEQRLSEAVAAYCKSCPSSRRMFPPTAENGSTLTSNRKFHTTSHSLQSPQSQSQSQPTPDPPNNGTTKQHQPTEFRLHSVFDDTSDNWEDWLSSVEYLDPWDEMAVVPLKDDRGLDTASRHLMALLQQRYLEGYAPENVSSQRCLTMMEHLLSDPTLDTYYGLPRALRVNTILKLMELFWDRVPNLAQTADRLTADPGQHRLSQTIQMQQVMEFPLPNLAAYSTLLRTLANMRYTKEERRAAATDNNDDGTGENTTIPDICLDVVMRMDRAHTLKGVQYMKQPRVVEWNQILAAWASSCHPQKAARAAACFLTMTQPPNDVEPDASSFGHLFRACAHHNENGLSKQLGAQIAIKVWRGALAKYLSKALQLSPQIVTYFCEAVKHVEQERERDQYIEQVWNKACSHGVVNEYVLAGIMTAHSSWRKLLGPYVPADSSGERKAILQQLPKEWSANLTQEINE